MVAVIKEWFWLVTAISCVLACSRYPALEISIALGALLAFYLALQAANN